MHRAALTDQTRKRSPLTLTSIKARPSIGFHLFLRIFQNALLSRFILCSEKRRQAVPTKPQIIGCIITHNSEAQINASERDHSTRGSQNLKKQKTVTPTIKGNATAVRSQNTKYYILRHGLSPRRHGFVLPANIRGTHAPPWLYHLPRPWPARSHKQARTRTGGAVTSRPTTAHAHPPKRCRPSYPLKSNQCKSYSPARHDNGAHHRSSYISPRKTPFAQALMCCA